jgi:hypothetical protein
LDELTEFRSNIPFLNAMGARGFNTYIRFNNPNISYALYLSPGKWSKPVTKREEEAETKKIVEGFNKKMAESEESIKKAQTEFKAEEERLKSTTLRGEARIREADDGIEKFDKGD